MRQGHSLRVTIRPTSTIRSAVVAATATFAVTATAGAAAAASYNFTFGPSPYGGYGRISGNLSYLSSGDRFSYQTYVEDLCPGDGYGVGFVFQIVGVGGQGAVTESKGVNQLGCGNTTYHYGNVVRNWKIARTSVLACWSDGGNPCWSIVPGGYSEWKDNPYT